MQANEIEDLGGDVFHIDTRMGGYAGITSGYLIRSSRPCLIETGTARSAPTVIAALDELGLGPEDLATIVVTHIHLDHVGSLHAFAERAGPAVSPRASSRPPGPTSNSPPSTSMLM